MGYYTYFDINIDGPINESKFAEDFECITQYRYPLEDTIKWYDFEANMIQLSSIYPDNFFTIYGDGEDSDDKWVCYFYRGNSQYERAEIVYADPDYSKLGNPHINSPELFI